MLLELMASKAAEARIAAKIAKNSKEIPRCMHMQIDLGSEKPNEIKKAILLNSGYSNQKEIQLSFLHLKIQNQKYISLRIKNLHMENILLHELSIHLLAFIRTNYSK